ncbi:MAG: tetratricopeptide repeat protein [Acidobacteria bacterium]|nr:tetratricopeptide repeat protein [Acidobacteriota bacterium]MBI3661855.1 tetratricopeptide repeat protein [Acidobacteriota bacterium]
MTTRRIVAICLLLAGGVALLALERRLVTAEITPRPLLYLVADTEREVERIPLALTRLSEREENQIGQELARGYGLMPAIHKETDAQRISAYVQEVGKRLTANVKRKEIQYRFFYKDEPGFVNAGALPGGQIVIGRGLLELLESEDELAAILGHEVAHVDERHAIERLQYEVQSKKIGMRGLYRLAQIGVVLYQMGYTKEKEDEADRLGLGLTVAAGYSPAGAVEVMKRFDRLFGGQAHTATSPVEEMTGMPLKSLKEYFRSHPPARERIATLEKEIQARGYNAAQAQKPLGVRAIFLAEQAEGLDKRGMFDRAIARYREALKLEPGNKWAWSGLAYAAWRAGDARTTVEAATEALKLDAEWEQMWKRLARALAVENVRAASTRYSELLARFAPKEMAKQSLAQVESAGLELTTGNKAAVTTYQEILNRGLTVETQVMARRQMAWWMYRSGRLKEAEGELEAARQRDPRDGWVNHQLAWVQSDLGRQADAQKNLAESRENKPDDADDALEAVILWRIDAKKEAQAKFQHAAEADPVWMVSKWVANNYSAEATAVIAKLQAEEMARRKKEEARRKVVGSR